MEYCINYEESYRGADGLYTSRTYTENNVFEFLAEDDKAARSEFRKFVRQQKKLSKKEGPSFSNFFLERIDQREKRTRL